MILLDDVVASLDQFFVIERFPDEPERLCRPSSRPIHRMGLALEPGPGLAEWVQEQQIDALFLHRPWSEMPIDLPNDVGIVSYHKPFDERLALGYNPRLASALGLIDFEVLGR
jgi:putative NIF3 family GTP cyclohydrolase 1 type 2